MMYRIDIKYDKDRKRTYKVLLDDGEKQKVIYLEIYMIRSFWFLNIRDGEEKLHIGQKINSYEDLFDICKRRYKGFPDVKLVALPINHNGFEVSFNMETAGILQDLVVISNE